MKRISTLSTLLLALPLGLAFAACDLEKEDGLDTGSVSEDDDIAEDEDEDEDEGEGGKNDDAGSASSSAGPGVDDSDTDGDESDTSVGGGDTEDDSYSSGGDGEADGIAILHGELPDIDVGGDDTGAGSGTDGDSSFPYDALLVIIDNDDSATCGDPWGASECGGNWSISFTLLPEQQVPGTYALFELNGFSSFMDEPHPEGDCAGGGGTLDGTIVIEAIDDATVVGHIENAEAWDFDANVSFVVSRC